MTSALSGGFVISNLCLIHMFWTLSATNLHGEHSEWLRFSSLTDAKRAAKHAFLRSDWDIIDCELGTVYSIGALYGQVYYVPDHLTINDYTLYHVYYEPDGAYDCTEACVYACLAYRFYIDRSKSCCYNIISEENDIVVAPIPDYPDNSYHPPDEEYLSLTYDDYPYVFPDNYSEQLTPVEEFYLATAS